MEKLYIVTGAAGHLGRVITQQLCEKGRHVRALVLPGEKNIPEKAEICFGNVCDRDSLEPCFDDLSAKEVVVIHCAGIVSIASKYSQAVVDVNVTGTRNVLALCKMHAVSKLVYVSSVHAIAEEPHGQIITESRDFHPDRVVGLYAKTKAQATADVLAAANQGLNACVVHPSGIIGPYDYGKGHLTALIIDYYQRRLTSAVKGGYDFVDVRDVAAGIIAACDKGRTGECYILSNRFFKVHEILDMLHDITGKRKIKSYLPLWFVKAAAPLAELYYKIRRQPPLFTTYSLYTLHSNARFSHQKASTELGYGTRDMKDTLRDTLEWLKAQGRI